MRTAAFVRVTLIWKPWVKQLFLHTMQLKSTRTLLDKLSQNQSVKAFFKSQSAPTNLDYETAVAEGTWAFHTVKHQQSFLSNDCTSHLFKTLFTDSDIAKKFASARTKTKSIITRVLGPYPQKILLSELGTQPFSVSVDASNHNQLKS